MNHADQLIRFTQDDHISREIVGKLTDEPLEFLVASGKCFVAAVIIACLLIGEYIQVSIGIAVLQAADDQPGCMKLQCAEFFCQYSFSPPAACILQEMRIGDMSYTA